MPWVSIREAAEDMLKVSRRTVERLVRAGVLQSRMEQGRRLVLIGTEGDPRDDSQGGYLDAELSASLFDAFEGLSLLLTTCFKDLRAREQFEKALAGLPDQGGRATLSQWKQLYAEIQTCYQKIEVMVRDMRCQTGKLQEVYRALAWVRIKWTCYAGGELSPNELQEDTTPRKESPPRVLTAVIENIRRLLAGCMSHDQ